MQLYCVMYAVSARVHKACVKLYVLQGLIHRRNRSVSAAPGVRALAFSALSHQPTAASNFQSESQRGTTRAPHSNLSTKPHIPTAHAASSSNEHLPHSAVPQHTREVSLREALQLTGPSNASLGAPGSQGKGATDVANRNMDNHSRAQSVHNSIDLSPRLAANASAADEPLGITPKGQQGSNTRDSSPACGTGVGNKALMHGRPNTVSYSPGAPQSSEMSPSKAHSVSMTTYKANRSRDSSPSSLSAHPDSRLQQLKPDTRQPSTDWYTYQQRMLNASQRQEPLGTVATTNSASEVHQGSRRDLHTTAPTVSPGKRRACRSVSPAKKAANSASHRSISPGRSPSSSHAHSMVPWRSPGKQPVLLGRSGMPPTALGSRHITNV